MRAFPACLPANTDQTDGGSDGGYGGTPGDARCANRASGGVSFRDRVLCRIWQREFSLLWQSPLRNANSTHSSNRLRPGEPIRGSVAPTDRFRNALRQLRIGTDQNNPDSPHVSAPIIIKYVTDLQLLGLL
jgi:hypothetical protein